MMERLLDEWRMVRGLTLDLLSACSETDLQFALSPGQGPHWKQFRHIGRVQEDYLLALATGHVDFDPANGSFTGEATVQDLLQYFAYLETRHTAAFQGAERHRLVDWFGTPVSVEAHLVRLISHETLHHGQLMLSWRALGHAFPASWSAWGEA